MKGSRICLVHVKSAFVDASNKDRFLDVLRSRTRNRTRVVLDLSQLRFVDSSGIGCLLVFAKDLIAIGGGLLVANPAPAVKQAFALVYLHHKIPICDTVETAVAEFDERIAAVYRTPAEEQDG